ncbi:MAG: hypothetical protein UZ05_CHB002003016 [Chlorobi bacterium OLB5]|nr:MAG: hypothetical protein UZ05_CHB002003016 [Chlorobi bacterium OLB5]
MDKVIKEFNGFSEAEQDDINYYSNLDPNEKIKELEQIREQYLNSINATEDQRRLQRVFEVVDRT